MLQSANPSVKFTRYTKDYPCPVCEGTDGKCDSPNDPVIVLCHNAREDRNGYKHLGECKNSYWHKFIRKDAESDRSYYSNGYKSGYTGRTEPRRTDGAKDFAARIKPEFEESAANADLLRRFNHDVEKMERLDPLQKAFYARSVLGLPVACMDAMPIALVYHKIMGSTLALPQYRADGVLQTVQFIGLMENRDKAEFERRKMNLAGRGSGLFLPINFQRPCHLVPVVEGARDVLVLFLMGIWAIGTLSAGAGADHLADWAKRNPDARLVLVVENDQKPDGRWPSMEGRRIIAARLAKLGVSCSIVLTPKGFKDVTDCFHGNQKLSYDYFAHYSKSFSLEADFAHNEQSAESKSDQEVASNYESENGRRFIDKTVLYKSAPTCLPQVVEEKDVVSINLCAPGDVPPESPQQTVKIALPSFQFDLDIPCPFGPKAAFFGDAAVTDVEQFIGHLRCGNSWCYACIGHRKDKWARRIKLGLETLAGAWYIGKNVKAKFRRKRAMFVKLIYDKKTLLIANSRFRGSRCVSKAKAMTAAIAFLDAMQPDRFEKVSARYGADGQLIEPERWQRVGEEITRSVSFTRGLNEEQAAKKGCEPWKGWPQLPEEPKERKFIFGGIVKRTKEQLEETFERWMIPYRSWNNLPKNISWAIEWSMLNLHFEQQVMLWKELGLAPRNGKTVEQMVLETRGLSEEDMRQFLESAEREYEEFLAA